MTRVVHRYRRAPFARVFDAPLQRDGFAKLGAPRGRVGFAEEDWVREGGKFSMYTGERQPGSSPDHPIQVESAQEGVDLMLEGKFIEMPRDQVSIALDKLATAITDREAQGLQTNVNLCQMSVPDTNLFCVESQGVPRIEMPQLVGTAAEGSPAESLATNSKGEVDGTQGFLESLAADGRTFVDDVVPANTLKATQNELNAGKVIGIKNAMAAGSLPPQPRYVVSSDNYILDGHHRWGAQVALEYDPRAPDTPVMAEVTRVDMPMSALLPAAQLYTEEQGIQQKGLVGSAWVGVMAALLETTVWLAYSEDQEREQGRFSGPGSGGKQESGGRAPGAGGIVDRMMARGGEGITISPVTGTEPQKADDGFIVGHQGGQIVKDADWADRDTAVNTVDSFLRDHADEFDAGGMVGIWHDTEHGEVAVDVVEHVADRAEATALGQQYDQQAVWDVANEEAVDTGGTGGREAALGEAAEAGERDDRRGAARVRGADRGRGERSRAGEVARLGEFDESSWVREGGKFSGYIGEKQEPGSGYGSRSAEDIQQGRSGVESWDKLPQSQRDAIVDHLNKWAEDHGQPACGSVAEMAQHLDDNYEKAMGDAVLAEKYGGVGEDGWYARAADRIGEEAAALREAGGGTWPTNEELMGMVASLSAHSSWDDTKGNERNINSAISLARTLQENPDMRGLSTDISGKPQHSELGDALKEMGAHQVENGNTIMVGQLPNAMRAGNGEGELSGLKVSAFDEQFLTRGNGPTTVVDALMVKASAPPPTEGQKPLDSHVLGSPNTIAPKGATEGWATDLGSYPAFDAANQLVAQEKGVPVSTAQAAAWGGYRGR